MLTPREKYPLPENFPRGGSNPRRCGQRAQTLPTSYSGPLSMSITLAGLKSDTDGLKSSWAKRMLMRCHMKCIRKGNLISFSDDFVIPDDKSKVCQCHCHDQKPETGQHPAAAAASTTTTTSAASSTITSASDATSVKETTSPVVTKMEKVEPVDAEESIGG